MALATSPSIFSYSSYLEFFQDCYDLFHTRDEKFSYDLIATVCDLKSRTHARRILKGIQKPNLRQILSIGRFFELGTDELRYLGCLFEFEQAKGTTVAFDLFRSLLNFQKDKIIGANPFKEIEIATSVLHLTLLSVFSFPKPSTDPTDLELLLKKRFSVAEIRLAIDDLQRAGYIQWNPSESKWNLLQKHIKKIDLNPNFFLKGFHEECLEIAKNSLQKEDPSQRYLVGANFSINEKVFPRIVQKVNAFLESLIQLETVGGEPTTVVQINAQLVKMVSHPPSLTVLKQESVLGLNSGLSENSS